MTRPKLIPLQPKHHRCRHRRTTLPLILILKLNRGLYQHRTTRFTKEPILFRFECELFEVIGDDEVSVVVFFFTEFFLVVGVVGVGRGGGARGARGTRG